MKPLLAPRPMLGSQGELAATLLPCKVPCIMEWADWERTQFRNKLLVII